MDFLDSLSNSEAATNANEVFDNEEAIRRIQERNQTASIALEEESNLDSLVIEDSKPLVQLTDTDFQEEANPDTTPIGTLTSPSFSYDSSSTEDDESIDAFETYPSITRQPSTHKRIPYKQKARPKRIDFVSNFKSKQTIAEEELADLMQSISLEERERLREMILNISIIVADME